MAPEQNSSASARLVLPAPPCPTCATLRILAGGKLFTGASLLSSGSAKPIGAIGSLSRDPFLPPGSFYVRPTLAIRRRAGPRAGGLDHPPYRDQRRPSHRQWARARGCVRGRDRNGPPRAGPLPPHRLGPARPARRRGGEGGADRVG